MHAGDQRDANGNSFPILLADHYSKGTIYILTIPDNFNDLYSYPVSVVSALKEAVLGDFPVRMEGPNKVSLFAYDNHTFVVESYLDHPATVTVFHHGRDCEDCEYGERREYCGRSSSAAQGAWGTAEHGPGAHELSDHDPAAQLRGLQRDAVAFRELRAKPRCVGGTAHGVLSRTGLGHGRAFRRKVRYSIFMGGPT